MLATLWTVGSILCVKKHMKLEIIGDFLDQLDGCDNKTATEFFLILDLTDPAVDAVPTSRHDSRRALDIAPMSATV